MTDPGRPSSPDDAHPVSRAEPAPEQPGDVFVADPADLFDDEPEPPKWPVVVGSISIVLGGLGTLCGAAIPLQGWLNSQFFGGLEGGAPDVLMNPPAISYLVGSLGLVGSIALLVAGIMCVLRKPASRPVFLFYAVVAIVSTLWAMKLQLDQQAAIEEWMQQNPNAQFTQMQQQAGASGALFGLGCTALVGLPWPAFCLFWFGFIKTKPEDFTGGADLDTI